MSQSAVLPRVSSGLQDARGLHHSSKFPVCTTSGRVAFCPRALSCLRHRAFLGPEIWPLGACALLLSSPARRAHGTHLSSVHLAAVQHMPGNAHPMCGFVAIAAPRFASRATGAMSCHGCPMHAGNRPHRHTLQCSPSQHWMPDAVARAHLRLKVHLRSLLRDACCGIVVRHACDRPARS